MDLSFTYDNGTLKITSEEKSDIWVTKLFYNDKLCTEIQHKESLLNPIHKNKIDQALKDLIPESERAFLLSEISDNFSKWVKTPEKIGISQEALDILTDDPLTFLLNKLEQVHPGDKFGFVLYIYSLMSLNYVIGSFVHVETVGKSGGGKSHGQKICKRLLPLGMQHSIDSMNTKSLIYYAKEHSLKNKLVIIDDATEKDIEMFKHVGDNGLEPFTYSTVIDGKYVEIKADYSPLIWFTKVSSENKGGQMSSRFLVYNIDESRDQRFKILDNIERDIEMPISPLCSEIISECINLDIKKIDPGEFKIPDPETIGFRDANFYKALIKCSALLNHQKRKISEGVLYAEPEDIKAVEDLWAELAIFNKHKLSKKYAMVYDLISDDIVGISTGRDQTINRYS